MKAERFRNAVRQHQDTGALLTCQKAARLLRIPQEAVLELAGDLDLNVNVGMGSGGWIHEFESRGDYTFEDLSYTPTLDP
jgi:hypothetical protein